MTLSQNVACSLECGLKYRRETQGTRRENSVALDWSVRTDSGPTPTACRNFWSPEAGRMGYPRGQGVAGGMGWAPQKEASFPQRKEVTRAAEGDGLRPKGRAGGRVVQTPRKGPARPSALTCSVGGRGRPLGQEGTAAQPACPTHRPWNVLFRVTVHASHCNVANLPTVSTAS